METILNGIKNPEVKSLIKSGEEFTGLRLNSVSPTQVEKERVDGKPSRSHYTASFKQGLFGIAFSHTFFQDHVGTGDKTSLAWKNSPNPEVLAKLLTEEGQADADGVKGYKLELTKNYEIDNGVRKTMTPKISFVVLPGEKFEDIAYRQFVAKGLIAATNKNVVESSAMSTAGAGKTTKA